MNDTLEKIAQRRSALKRLIDSPYTMMRGVRRTIDNMYDEEVTSLEEVDNNIREIKGPGGEPLKSLLGPSMLKSLKRNNRAHHWLAVLDVAAQINFVAKSIVEEGNKLRKDRADKIKDFYFSKEDASGQGVNLDNIYKLIRSNEDYDLVKEALFKELGLGRGSTHKFLSRLFDTKMKEAKRNMNILVNRAESLVHKILDTYKRLDSLRNKGDVGGYIDVINSLEKSQKDFEKFYKSVYESVKDFIPQLEEEAKKSENKKPDEPEAPEASPQKPNHQPGLDLIPVEKQPEEAAPVVQEETIDTRPYEDVVTPKRSFPAPPEHVMKIRDEDIEYMDEEQKTASKRYIDGIKVAYANGDVGLAAALMSSYSQYLEDNGFIDSSIKALATAEVILNG